jgi:hypothetical protein
MKELIEQWENQFSIIEEAIDVGELELNDWEQDFYDSVRQQFYGKGKNLSFKQSSILRKIYDKVE